MADNYLEKKMEELRSGKMRLAASKTAMRQSSYSGYLTFPFSSKNIVVIAPYSSLAEEVISFFRSVGCKLAVFGKASEEEEMKIHQSYIEQGIRVISTEISNDSDLYLIATEALFSDWKRVDIILDFSYFNENINYPVTNALSFTNSKADIFTKDAEDYNCTHPAPSDYQQRLIRICLSGENPVNKNLLRLTGRSINSFTEMILFYKEEYGANAKFKQNLMFLTLPQASGILNKD